MKFSTPGEKTLKFQTELKNSTTGDMKTCLDSVIVTLKTKMEKRRKSPNRRKT